MRLIPPTPTIRARWGAELIGATLTIERLERILSSALQSPHDLFVARFRDIRVLQTAAWNGIDDSWVVRDLAQQALICLEGAGRLTGTLSPLYIKNVVELDLDGNFLGESISSDEVLVLSKEEPSPIDFRRRLYVIQNISILQEAAANFSGQITWFGIYRAIECLEEYLGGENQAVVALKGLDIDLKAIKRNANFYRHYSNAFKAIKKPMTMIEAQQAIQQALLHLIDQVEISDESILDFNFSVPQYVFNTPEKIGKRVDILVNGVKAEVAFEGDICVASDQY